MQEIWKDIKGYENLYQVSNYGNVRSLNHFRSTGKGQCLQKGKILKPGIQNVGYKFVVLSKNGKTKGFRVHRLVAQTFIENPNNYPCINHKDENKLNNNVDNLEWCTIGYNNVYGTKPIKYKKTIKKVLGKKINQYDLDGNLINSFDCIMDAERFLNKKRASTPIWTCCKGKTKTAYGYRWEYQNQV